MAPIARPQNGKNEAHPVGCGSLQCVFSPFWPLWFIPPRAGRTTPLYKLARAPVLRAHYEKSVPLLFLHFEYRLMFTVVERIIEDIHGILLYFGKEVDWIIPVMAVFGFLLSIYNTWTQSKQRKVRMRVTPLFVRVTRLGPPGRYGSRPKIPFLSPGIEIVNLSSFPISVAEVGYELKSGLNFKLTRLDTRGRYVQAFWIPDKLPQRLDARSSLRIALSDDDEEHLKGKEIRRCYVITECHTKVYGRNRHLRDTAEKLARGLDVFEAV